MKLLQETLQFGFAAKPLSCGEGLTIGGGTVLPEINFTLPSMRDGSATPAEVAAQYTEMTTQVAQRAVDLEAPGIVVEIELLPPMTLDPAWGGDITAIVRGILDGFHQKYGLAYALRMTPVDVRDNERPPQMRSGHLAEKTLASFEHCARNGAHLLSIESTGGKELHDEALLNGDVPAIVYALGVLAPRDMEFLWKRVVEISAKHGCIPAGDTACGFGNTAMVLADKGMIPRVLAATVRVATVARSLEAYRQGARGPSKDCAYEGPYLKAMLGIPISMEGKSSACAHLSHVGNIAGACCDLWSNESVQNVRLLSAAAPVVSMENLIYDCRLMNRAIAGGPEEAAMLQRWMVESDSHDPQAWVLRPDVVLRLSRKLVEQPTPLAMTICAVRETVEELRTAWDDGHVRLGDSEQRWLDLLSIQAETIPDDEETLAMMVEASQPERKFLPEEYDLGCHC